MTHLRPSQWLVLFAGFLAACSGKPAAEADAGSNDAGCATPAPEPGIELGPSVVLSDPARNGFAPAVAARAGQVLVAWHESTGADSQIAYQLINDGCLQERHTLPEALPHPMHVSAAATSSGFVLVYDARDHGPSVVRTATLDAAGNLSAGPETLSAPGSTGTYPRVAASGEQLAFAWTDSAAHYFALRGPETLAAAPVGTTLKTAWALNFPRIAVDASGTVFLAWPDGDSSVTEVYLVRRSRGGSFDAPVNVSLSPTLMSGEPSLAMEDDGALEVVWNEQAPINPDAFEVTWRRRSSTGELTAPKRFGNQGGTAWGPQVAPGLAAVWQLSPLAESGQLFFSPGPVAPIAVFSGIPTTTPAIARAPDGSLHVAFAEVGATRAIRYAWRR